MYKCGPTPASPQPLSKGEGTRIWQYNKSSRIFNEPLIHNLYAGLQDFLPLGGDRGGRTYTTIPPTYTFQENLRFLLYIFVSVIKGFVKSQLKKYGYEKNKTAFTVIDAYSSIGLQPVTTDKNCKLYS